MPKKPKKFREEKIAEEYFPVDEEDLKYTTEKIEKPSQEISKTTVEKSYKQTEKEIVEKIGKKKKRKYTRKKPMNRKFREDNKLASGSEQTPQRSVDNVSSGGSERFRGSEKNSETMTRAGSRVGFRVAVGKKQKGSASTKKSKSASEKIKNWEPQKISLKKNTYELIITEKPQAAAKIANALGKSKQKYNNKISYYEVARDGKEIVVACAVGHLFTLKQTSAGSEVPVFDIKWVPNYLALKKDFTKKYLDTISKLAKGAGEITVATDFDVEGEVIGMNVVRFLCGQKDANRMKFSTLTEKELNESYEKKLPSLEWGQAIAGETRHYLDWFYGINLSRALMNAVKTTGRFKIMSIGRVQGPALNLIVQKEREILKFKPETYWQIFITVQNSHKLELKHNKDIFEKSELQKFENIVGKTAIAQTKKTEQIIPPNPPFNLTTLQTEAYKFHSITPSNTLRAAQSLYLSGLISYPRTSSQKLPDSIDYKSILKKLAKEYNVEHLTIKQKPIEGKKTDPAHPSIYPTGNKQILSGDEDKIYNLIVRRFLSLFCESAIIDKKKISAKVDDLIFTTEGSSIRRKAWMEIYPTKQKEIEIPDLDGEVKIVDSRTEEKETQPPKRYSPASIISALEKKNLGTKATRSSILETLYDRNYIKETSITATPLGMSLISTLEKYSPVIIDEKLTRSFEDQMESIQNISGNSQIISREHNKLASAEGASVVGKGGRDKASESEKKQKNILQEKQNKVLDKAKETITEIAEDFEKNNSKIGKELIQANDDLIEQQKIENTLMQCPKCKKGNLAITYSPKTKRSFIACNAYPDCKNTFPLPPNGVIKKANQLCEECGFPMLMRLMKGKRPWIFCWNPECPTNAEWVKRAREKASK